ncbi:unnamed protein product [Pleuronectes platessa]|uniref:Secreted protein n=1 Tax=Pleuronectes platessa TaxID=8262 RepID=A0A9N7UY07_PLEPL|nr:unnamed protein product [Pleuronectes platessa]
MVLALWLLSISLGDQGKITVENPSPLDLPTLTTATIYRPPSSRTGRSNTGGWRVSKVDKRAAAPRSDRACSSTPMKPHYKSRIPAARTHTVRWTPGCCVRLLESGAKGTVRSDAVCEAFGCEFGAQKCGRQTRAEASRLVRTLPSSVASTAPVWVPLIFGPWAKDSNRTHLIENTGQRHAHSVLTSFLETGCRRAFRSREAPHKAQQPTSRDCILRVMRRLGNLLQSAVGHEKDLIPVTAGSGRTTRQFRTMSALTSGPRRIPPLISIQPCGMTKKQ